jgi:hypothetical protein
VPKKELAQSRALMSTEIREMMGAPPVLATEDTEAYEQMFAQFATAVHPKDLIEWFLVRDLTDARWEIQRYRVLKALVIQEAQKEKVKRLAGVCEASFTSQVWGLRATARSVLAPVQTETGDKSKNETEKFKAEREEKLAAEIDKLTNETAKKLELLHKPATNAEYAGALEDWIMPYQQADRLQSAAEKRFESILEQLDQHRVGLGLRLRQVSDEIIDGEFEEAPAVALQAQVPPVALARVPDAIAVPAVNTGGTRGDAVVVPGGAVVSPTEAQVPSVHAVVPPLDHVPNEVASSFAEMAALKQEYPAVDGLAGDGLVGDTLGPASLGVDRALERALCPPWDPVAFENARQAIGRLMVQ